MEDYESSALRHFKDAEILRTKGEIDNAGHLIGFAAECAIKFRIAALRPSQGSIHGHLPDLLAAARKHTGQRNSYVSMHQLLKNEIFKDWHVNRRYISTGHTTDEELEEWFQCAKRLFATARITRR